MTKVQIDYTNYRGERGWRTIQPRGIFFGSTEYNPDPEWLLIAHDVVKGRRVFAMKDIHAWKVGEG
jgi:hypothetical protein